MGSTISGTAVGAPTASTDWDLTRSEIITAAMRKLKVIKQGATPSSDQLTYGSEQLNAFVKELDNDGVRLWSTEWATQALSATNVSFTMDTDIFTIEKAFIRDSSGNDYPVKIVTLATYFDIVDKDASGRPFLLAPDFNGGKAYIYYAADGSYTLHFLASRRQADMDTAGSNPEVPPRWYLALVYGLADLLAPEFDVSTQDRQALAAQAAMYKARALRGDKVQTHEEEDFCDSAY